jgi:hypothetical protein
MFVILSGATALMYCVPILGRAVTQSKNLSEMNWAAPGLSAQESLWDAALAAPAVAQGARPAARDGALRVSLGR